MLQEENCRFVQFWQQSVSLKGRRGTGEPSRSLVAGLPTEYAFEAHEIFILSVQVSCRKPPKQLRYCQSAKLQEPWNDRCHYVLAGLWIKSGSVWTSSLAGKGSRLGPGVMRTDTSLSLRTARGRTRLSGPLPCPCSELTSRRAVDLLLCLQLSAKLQIPGFW